ncbi:DUF1826 domain-containing protein [Halpernia frigidisoli]|uniref:DUF1826 domain-containing protein n=1 Tax=Halpernia frigidisoli TaxID=1125876 RepID=A0A1I3GXY7_9FLAO|nr:DUF1826 domain-containing protein [Halpernia frigidisoli]SFI28354.1 hypothetical protein SAMN05443292_2087 [Halpernia frigidisoli]
MSHNFINNNQIKVVSAFEDLINNDFTGDQNAVCWERNLDGDFEEIVLKLQIKENITEIFSEDLLSLKLSEKGNTAREIILNDLQLLEDFGASPSLNLIKNYERDDASDFISTDVYSFHVDHSPIESSTFLCTYFGAASDILPNDEAVQKVLIPQIREKLKNLYNVEELEFETFVRENYFDLHYEPKINSKPVNLGLGNLWRLAVESPEQKVLPCIHRAPLENKDEYRLLLIC